MSIEITSPRRTMRIRMVAEKTGLAASSIWRLARKGQFPPPVRLSAGCTAWFEHEIDEWLNEKAMDRETATKCSLACLIHRSCGESWRA
jgi:prophage regulatory protein